MEFGVLVPLGTLQFERTALSVVAVTGLWAYSNGFAFMVTRLGPGLDGTHEAGPESTPSPRRRRGGSVPHRLRSRESMAIGLAFADRSQVLGHVLGPAGNEPPPGRVLHPLDGVVKTHRDDTRWWTWPLAPSGRLDFICQLGETERRVTVDAQLILDASQRSAPAWQPDASAVSEPPPGLFS
jgi:hypothetical protein